MSSFRGMDSLSVAFTLLNFCKAVHPVSVLHACIRIHSHLQLLCSCHGKSAGHVKLQRYGQFVCHIHLTEPLQGSIPCPNLIQGPQGRSEFRSFAGWHSCCLCQPSQIMKPISTGSFVDLQNLLQDNMRGQMRPYHDTLRTHPPGQALFFASCCKKTVHPSCDSRVLDHM